MTTTKSRYLIESSYPVVEYVVHEIEAESAEEAIRIAQRLDAGDESARWRDGLDGEHDEPSGNAANFWDATRQDADSIGPARHVLSVDDKSGETPDLSSQPPDIHGAYACVDAARFALNTLANMTTQEFQKGGDREIRAKLAEALGLDPDGYVGWEPPPPDLATEADPLCDERMDSADVADVDAQTQSRLRRRGHGTGAFG